MKVRSRGIRKSKFLMYCWNLSAHSPTVLFFFSRTLLYGRAKSFDQQFLLNFKCFWNRFYEVWRGCSDCCWLNCLWRPPYFKQFWRNEKLCANRKTCVQSALCSTQPSGPKCHFLPSRRPPRYEHGHEVRGVIWVVTALNQHLRGIISSQLLVPSSDLWPAEHQGTRTPLSEWFVLKTFHVCKGSAHLITFFFFLILFHLITDWPSEPSNEKLNDRFVQNKSLLVWALIFSKIVLMF